MKQYMLPSLLQLQIQLAQFLSHILPHWLSPPIRKLPHHGLNEEHPYVFICHGDAAEQAEKEKAAILEAVPQAQVIIMPMSPIIGIHTGPGVQAVIYFGNNR